jgi:hypothetical protein
MPRVREFKACARHVDAHDARRIWATSFEAALIALARRSSTGSLTRFAGPQYRRKTARTVVERLKTCGHVALVTFGLGSGSGEDPTCQRQPKA